MNAINIVKIGSDSVSEKNIKKLLTDIRIWEEKTGEKFIIISSGSVKLGKEKLGNGIYKSKGLLASVGQKLLMDLFSKYSGDTVLSQILLDDYVSREYIENMLEKLLGERKLGRNLRKFVVDFLLFLNKNKDKHLADLLVENFNNDLLSIINHNDALSSDELNNLSDKTDNDKNVVHVVEALSRYSDVVIKRVIFLTNTDGVLDENKNIVTGGEINLENLKDERKKYLVYVIKKNSNNDGTGGMDSKINSALDCLEFGVRQGIIANAEKGLEFLWKGEATKFSLQNSEII